MMISLRVQLLIVSLILVSGCGISSSSKMVEDVWIGGYLGPIVVDFSSTRSDPDTVSITDNKGLPIENNKTLCGTRSIFGVTVSSIFLIGMKFGKRYSRKRKCHYQNCRW